MKLEKLLENNIFIKQEPCKESDCFGFSFSTVVHEINQVLGFDIHTDLLISAAKDLLSDEQSPKRRRILGDLLRNLRDNSEVESREEDKEWFEGK